MAQPKSKPATCADIEALPAHVVGEIAFGSLHMHPRPSPRHGNAVIELQTELMGPFGRGRGGPGGRIFQPEPELHLGEHVLVPDIAGWHRERMPELPSTAYFEVPPDWICEVLSPATMRFDRTDKLAIYAVFGVPFCWYVDPLSKTLEVLALQSGKWLIAATYKDDDLVVAPPFEAHAFSLDVLWSHEEGT